VKLRVGMNDKAYLYHIYCKVKNRIQENNNSYNPIKMCTCMDMIYMVRWILGPEWVLDVTILDEMLWGW
jgi:hypothetical protein